MHFHIGETVSLEVRVPQEIYDSVAKSGQLIQRDAEALMAEALSYALADEYASVSASCSASIAFFASATADSPPE